MASNKRGPDNERLNRLVAEARRNREERQKTYREQALKILPWLCGRCAREFTRANLYQLTVHHKDGNHDNNPPDGSNWELLCVYCHDNEHSRILEHDAQGASPAPGGTREARGSYKAFADLEALMKKRDKSSG
jgi:hypothetical protein